MVGGIPLREWRELRGLTQQELAEASGVGIATVVRVEKGDQARPSTRRKLADALKISHEDLLAGPPARVSR
jgi:transcriptional regulator with XRE-family HTH domain